MGVAPCDSFRSAFLIAVGDVHASEISDLSVDHHYLAVVAPVDAVGKLREGYAEKGVCFHSVFSHAFEKAASCREASHVVVNDLDFESFARFADKDIGNLFACGIVGKYIILKIYRFACIVEIAFEIFEFLGSGGEYLNVIVNGIKR